MGLDNGLAPNRQHCIIWTNDGLCCRHIFASLSLNELKEYKTKSTHVNQPVIGFLRHLGSNPGHWCQRGDNLSHFNFALELRISCTNPSIWTIDLLTGVLDIRRHTDIPPWLYHRCRAGTGTGSDRVGHTSPQGIQTHSDDQWNLQFEKIHTKWKKNKNNWIYSRPGTQLTLILWARSKKIVHIYVCYSYMKNDDLIRSNYTHAMTTHPSWHVQNCNLARSLLLTCCIVLKTTRYIHIFNRILDLAGCK